MPTLKHSVTPRLGIRQPASIERWFTTDGVFCQECFVDQVELISESMALVQSSFDADLVEKFGGFPHFLKLHLGLGAHVLRLADMRQSQVPADFVEEPVLRSILPCLAKFLDRFGRTWQGYRAARAD